MLVDHPFTVVLPKTFVVKYDPCILSVDSCTQYNCYDKRPSVSSKGGRCDRPATHWSCFDGGYLEGRCHLHRRDVRGYRASKKMIGLSASDIEWINTVQNDLRHFTREEVVVMGVQTA